MLHRWTAAAFVGFVAAGLAAAQAPQFAWKGGTTLTYKVQQQTSVSETVRGEAAPLTTATKLDLEKRWQVADVAADGTATLQMTLVSLRMEVTPPRGEKLLFDSAKLAESTEAMRSEMAQYIGQVLTVVRVGPSGQLVEVKESKFGPASRLEAELPFKLVLPAEPFKPGLTWERKYQIKLDPPQGAGETYQAVTKYSHKGVAGGFVVVGVASSLLNPPAAAADQIPLIALQPEGDVYFDPATGRLRAVRSKVVKEIANHRGEGSKYYYQSSYAEDLVGDK